MFLGAAAATFEGEDDFHGVVVGQVRVVDRGTGGGASVEDSG